MSSFAGWQLLGLIAMKYCFGQCEIDTERHEFRVAGEAIQIEPQVFDLLAYLAANPSRLITKDELVEAIWDGRAISDSAITTRIKDARKAVGDDGERQAIIATVARRGIRMVAPVEVVASPAGGIGVAVQVPPILQASASVPGERPTTLPTVGFVPFALSPPDTGLEYLATGLCDEINSELGRYHSLAVLARHSTQQVANHDHGDYSGLKALGATHGVRGRVQVQGDDLRITVQLIQLDTHRLLWAERYAIGRQELFAMQNDVVACIVEAIFGRVTEDRLAGARMRPTASLDAYDCVLRGMALHRGATTNCTPANAAAAIAWYDRAIELDPSYARAYGWRACANVVLWPNRPLPEHLDRCLAENTKAYELDPLDAEINRTMSGSSLYLRRFDAAAFHLEKSRTLNPNSTQNLMKCGLWLSYLGDNDRSVVDVVGSMRRNPLHPPWYWRDAGIVLLNRQDYAAAWNALNLAPIVRHIDLVYRTACLVGLGELGEARAHAARLRQEHPEFELSSLDHQVPYCSYRQLHDLDRLRDLLGQAGVV